MEQDCATDQRQPSLDELQHNQSKSVRRPVVKYQGKSKAADSAHCPHETSLQMGVIGIPPLEMEGQQSIEKATPA